jgi:ABC-type multidrug transport system ATPase subunit
MKARGSSGRTCLMSASTILQFEQLVLSRGKQRVAGPLDLSLPRGQHGLVTGPNGSGKTTLVLAIAGLMAPTSGKLLRPERIGLVPQEPEFPLHLRCSDYFRQLLALQGKAARRADETDTKSALAQDGTQIQKALRLFQLEPFAKRRIGELSRGWRQRLNLARGWLAEPELLILDEPQTALDPSGMAALTAALAEDTQTAALIVAPAGVGCESLAPLVMEL